jgi:cytochrome c oxidase assembly protein subunit 15
MNNKYHPALFWFAVINAVTTFLLIGLGGLVTSREAGMSVPDWPTTYGYNMFLTPIDKWLGEEAWNHGIFFEHSHRLLASSVGFLTTILAIWLLGRAARPYLRWGGLVFLFAGICIFWVMPGGKVMAVGMGGTGLLAWLVSFFWPLRNRSAGWLCWLGLAAFLLVVLQGILGGLRVRWSLDYLGVPHGAIGQLFLVLTAALALFTSRWWIESADKKQIAVPRGLRSHVLFVTFIIFVQLLIAATMRHQHAGLAIWDFPLAHGKVWPETSAAAIAQYNAHRPPGIVGNPITALQIDLQMAHRLVAYAIFLGVLAVPFIAKKRLGLKDGLTKFAWVWLGLITAQVGLGAWTIWSNKAADITTLHVMVGALSLLAGALWVMIAARRTQPAN